jgi:hypothetical protein
MNRKVLFIGLLVLLCCSVTAIGIMPARSSLEGLSDTGKFKVVNTEHEALRVKFTIEGPLRGYISVDPEILIFDPAEGRKEVKFLINGTPPIGGATTNYIIVEQLHDDASMIGMSLAVKHKIEVKLGGEAGVVVGGVVSQPVVTPIIDPNKVDPITSGSTEQVLAPETKTEREGQEVTPRGVNKEIVQIEDTGLMTAMLLLLVLVVVFATLYTRMFNKEEE